MSNTSYKLAEVFEGPSLQGIGFPPCAVKGLKLGSSGIPTEVAASAQAKGAGSMWVTTHCYFLRGAITDYLAPKTDS
jgi:hypothetical protein